MNLELDFTARDKAMAKVADHAETHSPDFAEQAQRMVISLLAAGEASSEALTMACKDRGLVPHDDRAFGPVYCSLSKRGLIVKAGSCPRSRGHGTSGGIVWKLAEGGRDL